MKAKIQIEYTNGEVETELTGNSFAILDALETTLAGLMNYYRKPGHDNASLAEDLKNRVVERLENTYTEEEGEQG